ncbi:RIO1 family regulatory kinase/ATPase [Curtobacterium sp. ZW137]|uniref:RIO1 family regulatory kinase/ATPase domain-containing protein n=1 Tax=Curtobacterium sp. ZW137 TaxID=2485104 RepID=UPI001619764B|nr:RIO1 family regulatory kinase/ATPase [Curtobacterium sp. ZW137]
MSRWIIGLYQSRRLVFVAKVGDEADSALASEADFLTRLQGGSDVFRVPELVSFEHENNSQVLITRAVPDDGPSLSRYDIASLVRELARLRITHGDLTPWNILGSEGQVWLIDWESASGTLAPGFDLIHHEVSVAALVTGASPRSVFLDLIEHGGVLRELLTSELSPAGPTATILHYITSIDWRRRDDRLRVFADALLELCESDE